MLSNTTRWGKSTIQIFNPNEPCKPIVICALEVYPEMMDDMNEYLNKIQILLEEGEDISTNETINYQMHWLVDHFDSSMLTPIVLLFDDFAQYINESEFPANVFDELSELERPTKSYEMILDINRRFVLYAFGDVDDVYMHDWVDSLFTEGTPEPVYVEK